MTINEPPCEFFNTAARGIEFIQSRNLPATEITQAAATLAIAEAIRHLTEILTDMGKDSDG